MRERLLEGGVFSLMFSQGHWGLRQKDAPSSASISMIYLLNTDNIPLDTGFSFVASVNSVSAAVGSRLAGNGHRCWLRKDSSAGRLPAAVPSGAALMLRASLKLPDLFTFQNYWWLAIFCNWFADISSCSRQQEQMTGGTTFSPDMCMALSLFPPVCPSGIEMCRRGHLVKVEMLPRGLLLPDQVWGFFCFFGGFFLPCFCH